MAKSPRANELSVETPFSSPALRHQERPGGARV